MTLGPILIGLPGTRLDGKARYQLRHPAVGGVVLFSRNFSGREQLKALVDEIRAARDPRPLVCIDQEGGRVQRLQDGFTRLPPLGALGAIHATDPVKGLDLAYRHGRVMATEMLAVGIDLSFAPVLDLDRGSRVIGNRALSGDPDVVIELGRSYLAGMHDAGMKTTGKHFPGHGSVAADSHTDDVCDTRRLSELQGLDLRPFAELSGALDALMIAHVVYPEVDSVPAGYSERWLGQILRSEMAYRGAVLSDDLGMHAARTAGSLAERAHSSLEAGCDLALVCLPGDVDTLLAGGGAPDRDASAVIGSLYGEPTVDGEELDVVKQEGIREWGHWQRSLEALNAQSWA
jgi:beta-N-acetylhexosaminidase